MTLRKTNKTPPLEAQQKDVRIIFKLQVVHTAKVHYSKIGMTSPQHHISNVKFYGKLYLNITPMLSDLNKFSALADKKILLIAKITCYLF